MSMPISIGSTSNSTPGFPSVYQCPELGITIGTVDIEKNFLDPWQFGVACNI